MGDWEFIFKINKKEILHQIYYNEIALLLLFENWKRQQQRDKRKMSDLATPME